MPLAASPENVLPTATGTPAPSIQVPTAQLRRFREVVGIAFERARDADDREACEAALRLLGALEEEIAARRG